MSFLGVPKATRRTCDPRIWGYQQMQIIQSDKTSINKERLPEGFTRGQFIPGTVNADIGGGKYDNGTVYLANQGVENVLFDPYNRSKAHNDKAVKRICGGQAATATINNVLNVIAEPAARAQVIERAYDALRAGGIAYFVIHEGGATRAKPLTPSETKSGWQERRLAETYIPEIKRFFPLVDRRGNMLIARK